MRWRLLKNLYWSVCIFPLVGRPFESLAISICVGVIVGKVNSKTPLSGIPEKHQHGIYL